MSSLPDYEQLSAEDPALLGKTVPWGDIARYSEMERDIAAAEGPALLGKTVLHLHRTSKPNPNSNPKPKPEPKPKPTPSHYPNT